MVWVVVMIIFALIVYCLILKKINFVNIQHKDINLIQTSASVSALPVFKSSSIRISIRSIASVSALPGSISSLAFMNIPHLHSKRRLTVKFFKILFVEFKFVT